MLQVRRKSVDESATGAQRVTRQPDEMSQREPLGELQQSAGNQALLGLIGSGLVVQKKAKDAGSETTPAPAAPSLIVEDEAKDLKPGQMRKSEFLSQLRTAVCSTAEQALKGTMWSAMGCPYIERWLDHYGKQPSAYVERALRKYAPETASARSAADYIPLVTQRVRRGIEEWRSTGEVKDLPEEFAASAMPGATVGGLLGGLLSGVGSAISGLVSGAGRALSSVGSMLFKHREGGEAGVEGDPQAVKAKLGSGQSLDSSVQRRMQSAFGVDFAGVRVHTDTKARELSEGMQARAFTIGNDIAFGAEEYKPGTPVGDALIAHELAHVVQQGGESATTQHKGGAESGSLEDDADRSAVGAVLKLWTGARGELSELGQTAMPRMRSGLRLQGCGGTPKKTKSVALSGDWATDVKAAKENSDEDAMLALAKKALEPQYQVNLAGNSSPKKEDPKDYKKAPVINFDVNLNKKEKWTSGSLENNVGHSFDSGTDTYAIIGPNALNEASPLLTRAAGEHELFHTTHHLGAAQQKGKSDDDEELEAWTNDFVHYFHQYLTIQKGRPIWTPLLDYYAAATTTAQADSIAKLKKYYESPVPDKAEAEKVRDALSLFVYKWKDREGIKNRKKEPISKDLITELDKFVKPYETKKK